MSHFNSFTELQDLRLDSKPNLDGKEIYANYTQARADNFSKIVETRLASRYNLTQTDIWGTKSSITTWATSSPKQAVLPTASNFYSLSWVPHSLACATVQMLSRTMTVITRKEKRWPNLKIKRVSKSSGQNSLLRVFANCIGKLVSFRLIRGNNRKFRRR